MTGHGGWPLNVFITPEQVPFYAGTYFPPEPRPGMPSWPMVLTAVAEAWETKREDIRAQNEAMAARLAGAARLQTAQGPLSAQVLDEAVAELRANFDSHNGGWGGAPKFPASSTIEFLLRRGEHDDDDLHAALDGLGRHPRPGRRRLRALLGRQQLDGPALREDALRQRPARARLPARLAGQRRSDPAPHGAGDARLDAARDDRAGGRVLQRARRGLRGRRGQVLRLEPRRAARGPRRGRRRGDRLVRRQRARQLRGREHPRVARRRAGARGARADPRGAAAQARRAGPARASTTSA